MNNSPVVPQNYTFFMKLPDGTIDYCTFVSVTEPEFHLQSYLNDHFSLEEIQTMEIYQAKQVLMQVTFVLPE